jgi:hypothetical protein
MRYVGELGEIAAVCSECAKIKCTTPSCTNIPAGVGQHCDHCIVDKAHRGRRPRRHGGTQSR